MEPHVLPARPHVEFARFEGGIADMGSLEDTSLDEVVEPMPSELNISSFNMFLEASKDKLTVRYTGQAQHENDVGSIQSNHPVPRKRLVYYYEVTVKEGSERGEVGLGFSDRSFKVGRHPGYVPRTLFKRACRTADLAAGCSAYLVQKPALQVALTVWIGGSPIAMATEATPARNMQTAQEARSMAQRLGLGTPLGQGCTWGDRRFSSRKYTNTHTQPIEFNVPVFPAIVPSSRAGIP